jgi:hypothetical protein
MQQLGWIIGRNMRIDTRWASGNADNARKYAAELVALAPDVILAAGSSTALCCRQNAVCRSYSQRGRGRVGSKNWSEVEFSVLARKFPVL